jgi:IS4 transposase
MYGSENHFLTSILLKCIDTAVTCIEHAELVHEGKIAEDIKDYLDKFEELVLKEEREKGIRHTDALQKLKDKILERINYCINERWNNL